MTVTSWFTKALFESISLTSHEVFLNRGLTSTVDEDCGIHMRKEVDQSGQSLHIS